MAGEKPHPAGPLLHMDPGSACQRLLNAAIHGLREKIIIAGVDIATEAAKRYRLPPITSPEDIENYTTSKLIDLAYRLGLLSRSFVATGLASNVPLLRDKTRFGTRRRRV